MKLKYVYIYMTFMIFTFIPEFIWSGLSAFAISSDSIFWGYFVTQELLIAITIMLIRGGFKLAIEDSYEPTSISKLRMSLIFVMIFFIVNTLFYMVGYFGGFWSYRIWNLTAGTIRFLIYAITFGVVTISGFLLISKEKGREVSTD